MISQCNRMATLNLGSNTSKGTAVDMLYLEDVDVRLQHDDPHARRCKLRLAVVQVCRDVPESDADEKAVEHVQDKLCAAHRGRVIEDKPEVKSGE